jgi:putative colanic acid biosynthesis UDP-glucose lipid carrier transferase
LEVILKKIHEDAFIGEAVADDQWPVDLYLLEHNRLDSALNRFLKRSVDLLLGGALALVLLPLLTPVVALLIKLESKGPVFFVQKRTGLNGCSFYCFKFRSMVVNNDADRKEVQPGDERITKVGHYLRKFYIDELPQLINVIRGDMSLVGPRPLMLRHTVLYSRVIPNYHDRHKVKPGLTGLAQVRGYHGIIATRKDLFLRTKSDLEYIQNWTVTGDIRIFFGTIFRVLVRW